MSYGGKLGKKSPAEGQQVVWSSVQLSNGGLTTMIMPANGMSGQAAIPTGVTGGGLFADIYAVSLTSSDSAVEAVTLSDGTKSITWQVGTSPVNDSPVLPYRFAAGQPLFVSAGAITSAKNINVQLRGVVTRT